MSIPSDRFLNSSFRALGMIDLNPESQTAGCADRNFWHYQDGKSFWVGSFQVVMLGLSGAALISKEYSDIFSQGSKLALSWWSQEILKKGSVDEYFLNQKSFCATAYTSMAAAVTMIQLEELGVSRDKNQLRALKKAVEFLAKDHQRPDSANQAMAARLAWDIASEHFSLVEGVNPFMPDLISEDDLGIFWLKEYGGFDLSYTLKCIDISVLALLRLKGEARSFYEDLLKKIIPFLHCIATDSVFDPTLSSRGNPHGLFGGLKVLAHENSKVKELVTYLEDTKRFPNLVRSETSDDKYFSFFHLTSLMLEEFSAQVKPGGFDFKALSLPDFVYFKKAALVFFKNKNDRLAISLLRGGACCLLSHGDVKVHSGYLLKDKSGLWNTTGVFVSDLNLKHEKISFALSGARVKSRGSLLQNVFISVTLKIALALPVFNILTRWALYKLSFKKSHQSKIVGSRQIIKTQDGFSLKDDFYSGFTPCVSLGEWIIEDGHSTRLFYRPQAGPARLPS